MYVWCTFNLFQYYINKNQYVWKVQNKNTATESISDRESEFWVELGKNEEVETQMTHVGR